jgi:hypothetical protein
MDERNPFLDDFHNKLGKRKTVENTLNMSDSNILMNGLFNHNISGGSLLPYQAYSLEKG